MNWEYTGQVRPPFAHATKVGEESVWDYPRPPIIVADDRHVEVRVNSEPLADSTRCLKVLETAGAPTFYLPPEDVNFALLIRGEGSSWCEWKGSAVYWCLASARLSSENVGWSYPAPTPRFTKLTDYVSFYPGRLACFVAGERVQPQPGGFYGGWVTKEVVGPIKGGPDTTHW